MFYAIKFVLICFKGPAIETLEFYIIKQTAMTWVIPKTPIIKNTAPKIHRKARKKQTDG